LAVTEIEILGSLIVYAQELARGIVGVKLFNLAFPAAPYLRHEEASVVAEGGGDVVHRLARADALLVVGIACGRAVAGKAQQALALPSKGVAPVGQRVADFIVGDALPVVAYEQVAPFGVVGIVYRVGRRAKRACFGITRANAF